MKDNAVYQLKFPELSNVLVSIHGGPGKKGPIFFLYRQGKAGKS
jgi:hypothetical protein